MSILIKGMDIPRFGYREIRIHPDGKVTERSHPEYPGYEECLGKAVPVPPHGRLIDADEFYKDINESVLLTDGFKGAFNLWFDEQTTIIPAEEGEA